METTQDAALTTKWVNDPMHSELQFKVRHMMINNVKGIFKDFTATILSNGEDFTTAKATVVVNVDSISTNVSQRDNHLRSDDFFNAEKHPTLKFESKEVIKKSDEDYLLKGILTIRDHSKEIELDVEYNGIITDSQGARRAGFSLSGKISRKEFGLKYNAALEAGGVVVGDEVKIYGDLEFLEQKES